MHFLQLLSGLTAIASPALVAAAPYMAHPGLSPRQSGSCEFNSATAPTCWGNYSLSTNWYEEAPNTGVIREYWFEIVNSTLAPDGVERMTLTVNGSIPGPTIEADWGDTVGKPPTTPTFCLKHHTNYHAVVHVKNSLQNNGTSIHWHGIRQQGTTEQDGVASITQCPVAPDDSMTYTWRATQVLVPQLCCQGCRRANHELVRNHLVSQPFLPTSLVSRRSHPLFKGSS